MANYQSLNYALWIDEPFEGGSACKGCKFKTIPWLMRPDMKTAKLNEATPLLAFCTRPQKLMNPIIKPAFATASFAYVKTCVYILFETKLMNWFWDDWPLFICSDAPKMYLFPSGDFPPLTLPDPWTDCTAVQRLATSQQLAHSPTGSRH